MDADQGHNVGYKSAGSSKTIKVRMPSAAQQNTTPREEGVRLLSAENTGFSDLLTPSTIAPSPQKNPPKHRSVSILSRPTSMKHKSIYDSQDPITKRRLASSIIERAWLSYRDKNMFRLLKHAICAAETSLTHEVLRKVSPKEAQITKDPSLSMKIRFRFGGTEFPPMIYFKIFSSAKDGSKTQYFSGKKVIKPASEAARDACDRMGNRKFYELVIQDAMHHQQHRITDEIDITTLKDYMQYRSNLDELPAYKGGRENTWRMLTLDVVPRQTVFYDVVDFLYSHTLTPRLVKAIPVLMSRPLTQEMQLKHIEVVSRVRTPPPTEPPNPARLAASRQKSDASSRRSQQAKRRASKMKKMYGLGPKEDTEEDMLPDDGEENFLEDGDEWEQEAEELYTWTQALDDQALETPKLFT